MSYLLNSKEIKLRKKTPCQKLSETARHVFYFGRYRQSKRKMKTLIILSILSLFNWFFMVYLIIGNDFRYLDRSLSTEEMTIIEAILFIISLLSLILVWILGIIDSYRTKRKNWSWLIFFFWPLVYIYVLNKFIRTIKE